MSEESGYTPSQRAMVELWEGHTAHEFKDRFTEMNPSTMTDDPVNTKVPLLTGGVGLEDVRRYYSEHSTPKNPPDTEVRLLSRTVGGDRVVEEMLPGFTRTTRMDWLVTGVPPTGGRVEVPTVGVVEFRDRKVAPEQIYWDQACVSVRVGLLDTGSLPVAGAESARRLPDPASVPSDLLIERAEEG